MSSDSAYLRDPSVAVIGGGIIGLSIAAMLLQRGVQATVYEPKEPWEQTSSGNAGALSKGSVAPFGMPGTLKKVPRMLFDTAGPLYVQPSYAAMAGPWLTRFVLASRRHRVEQISRALAALHRRVFEDYERLLDFCSASDLIRRTGQIHLYRDRSGLAGDDASWRLRHDRGVEFHAVEGAELRELEPAISESYKIGVFMPNEGMISSPQSLLVRLREAIIEAGGIIRPVRIKRLRVAASGGLELQSEGDTRLHGQAVISAGAWSGELCRQVGLKVPLETQRGYHVMYAKAETHLNRPITAADRKIFASPIDGGIRVSGTVEFAGLDRPMNLKRCDALQQHGSSVLPDLPTSPSGTWMGHRPCLPDSLPVIGRSPSHAGLYFAFGHGHLGMTGAAATAAIISQQVLGEDPGIDLAPFAVDRF